MFLETLLFLFATAPHATALPPGKGKAIVERTCASCHAIKVVTSKKASKEQWSTIIDQMLSKGADLNDDEVEIVVDYLSRNFGATKDPTPAEKFQSHSRSVGTRGAARAD
jgi:mono/diheme cytochrome c family protein